MTEESFQQGRKFMSSANHLRGLITTAKGNVAKWTAIEHGHRQNLREAQADGAKKYLDKALNKLNQLREKFAAMQFPDSNIKVDYKPTTQCQNCGARVAEGNDYCGECLCEDDIL